MNLGTLLRNQRLSLNASLGKVAGIWGVSRQMASRVELGAEIPQSVDNLTKIANAYGLPYRVVHAAQIESYAERHGFVRLVMNPDDTERVELAAFLATHWLDFTQDQIRDIAEVVNEALALQASVSIATHR